jgi:single-strand DNA-binding protein
MDLNLIVLAGKLAAPPELRTFDSGTRLVRFLVTTRSEEPGRRVDVVPVTLWDPDDTMVAQVERLDAAPGRRLWVAGAVQRRFWEAPEGRRSRLEVVAHQVDIRPAEEDDDPEAC